MPRCKEYYRLAALVGLFQVGALPFDLFRLCSNSHCLVLLPFICRKANVVRDPERGRRRQNRPYAIRYLDGLKYDIFACFFRRALCRRRGWRWALHGRSKRKGTKPQMANLTCHQFWTFHFIFRSPTLSLRARTGADHHERSRLAAWRSCQCCRPSPLPAGIAGHCFVPVYASSSCSAIAPRRPRPCAQCLSLTHIPKYTARKIRACLFRRQGKVDRQDDPESARSCRARRQSSTVSGSSYAFCASEGFRIRARVARQEV
jgi:hypothetical protein